MNNNLIEVIFIMDASGSMQYLSKDVIGGFNSLIEKQKKDPVDCNITTVFFNSSVRTIHNCVPIKEVQSLTDSLYIPYGTTALLDAVGETIDKVGSRLAETPEEQRPCKVMVVITTDGYENASQKYTKEKIKEMISRQQNTYNWTFLFLGANIDAVNVGNSYGITSGHSYNYTANTRGTQSVYSAVSDTLSYVKTSSGNLDEQCMRSLMSTVE